MTAAFRLSDDGKVLVMYPLRSTRRVGSIPQSSYTLQIQDCRETYKPTKPMTTDTPQLNDHKQNCDSASAKGKPACIMPSDSNFAAGKAEYPPMHSGEFDTSPTTATQ